jgi:hypothetical protein
MFAFVGTFDGSYVLMADKIQVTVPQAMIHLRDVSSYRGPRELTAIRLRLAHARPKDHWALGAASGRIAIRRVMRPGNQVTLDSLHFALPRPQGGGSTRRGWYLSWRALASSQARTSVTG